MFDWPDEITLTAFDTLNIFVYNLNTRMNESLHQCVRDLTVSLCLFVDLQLKDDNLVVFFINSACAKQDNPIV